ncbi:MAG: hypothetical protein R2830_08425 [Saprospiraceae bacterium]
MKSVPTANFHRTGLRTPVLFMIFNRPEETARGLAILREARPERLYVVSDAARAHVEGEAQLVEGCRDLIEQIDWPCTVKKNYARHNLNCGIRVASGLYWFFRHEPKGIVVEDDLLPDLSFFSFCEAMLEKYEANKEVMLVSGRNNLGQSDGRGSYFFSRTVNPWGWASWARAWQHYRFTCNYWTPQTRPLYQEILQDTDQADFHDYNERQYQGRLLDTWDIQWTYSVFRQKGLSIVPKVNLVQNTGFHPQGTHTHNDFDLRAALPAFHLPATLVHPKKIGYEKSGLDFDRQNFLLEQLAALKNPQVLSTIYRMYRANSGASNAALQERYKDVIPYLYPLAYPQESRDILVKLKPHLPGNEFLENLLHFFENQLQQSPTAYETTKP